MKTIRQQAYPIYHHAADRDPNFYDNPPVVPYMWLNGVSGELWCCTYNEVNANVWRSKDGFIADFSGHYLGTEIDDSGFMFDTGQNYGDHGLHISADGTKVVVMYSNAARVFTLSTPNDVSTAVYTGGLGSPHVNTANFCVSADGLHFAMCEDKDVYHYQCNTPYTFDGAWEPEYYLGYYDDPSLCCFSEDGLKFFYFYYSDYSRIKTLNLNTPFDIASVTGYTEVSGFSYPNYCRSMSFNRKGNYFYMAGGNGSSETYRNSYIYEYALDNNFDLTGLGSAIKGLTLPHDASAMDGRVIHGLDFSHNGDYFICHAGAATGDHQLYQFSNNWIEGLM